MKYNLYLDDFRQPVDSFSYTKDSDYLNQLWVTVRSYEEFVKYIEKMFFQFKVLPTIISFDHDLADEHYYPLESSRVHQEALEEGALAVESFYRNNFKERTGYCCAQWLVEFCIDYQQPLPAFKIHSQNPAGAENIRALLNNFKKHQANH